MFFNKIAFAAPEAICKLNGEEIPCKELQELTEKAVTKAVGFSFLVIAIFIGLLVLLLVFWVMMLVHAASHPIKNKVIWIIVILFTGALGSTIYYFVVKRNFNQSFSTPTKEVATNQTTIEPPATPTLETPTNPTSETTIN